VTATSAGKVKPRIVEWSATANKPPHLTTDEFVTMLTNLGHDVVDILPNGDVTVAHEKDPTWKS
jgi:hypothetical protein